MSNLLEQASLVMIPSGYKEDIVYSVIPTSGAGDLTFTRASNGTRIDSNGNVEVVPWNLFGNSEDGTSGKWGNEYNIASVTLNSTTAPNGTNTGNLIVENSVNSTHWFEQSFSAIVGTPYTISVYFKAKERTQCVFYGFADNGVFLAQIVIFDLSTGAVVSQSGTQTNSIENVGNGWYRCSMTLTSGASATGYFAYGLANGGNQSYQGNGTSGLYMWGRQLNTGTLKPYFPTTDRLNVPRLTYQNGGGGCPSLLLEKQSTNINTYSEDFSNAVYIQEYATITTNQTTSPDGTSNADKFTDNSINNYHIVYPSSLTITTSRVSSSVYVKNNDIQFCAFQLATSIGGTYDTRFTLIIDLINGTITDTEQVGTPNAVYSIQNVGNGWYRLNLTCDHSSGSVAWVVGGSNSGTPSTFVAALPTYIGTGKSLFIWGAQVEASSYPTSYIPTTSSSATRVADVCNKNGIGALIGGTSGTVFFDVKTNPVLSSANYKQFCYYFDSASAQSYMYLDGSNLLRTNANWGSLVGSTLQPNTQYKVALTYAPNDFALYVNGVSVATATSGTPKDNVNISIGQITGTEMCEFVFNEYIHFPSRLTNSELAQLTGNQNYTINQAYESYGVASESPNCVQP